MKISVLICTRNRPQDIVWCLPAVLASEYPDFEVVLVDQSDGKETAAIAEQQAKLHSNLVYIPTETRGKCLALNLGVSACKGEIVACTDDDTEMEKTWVAQVARLFEQEPDLDMAFGQVLPPSDKPSDSAVPALIFEERRQLLRGDIFGMGANMAFRRALYQRLNGYDNVMGPGAPLVSAEEFDFLYRAQCLGAKIIAEPSLRLVHRAHRSREQWDKVMYLYGVGDAAFYLKHARCGDLRMAGKYTYRVIHAIGKGIFGPLVGKGAGKNTYLKGLWHGFSKSWQFGVDRNLRLYRTARKTGGAPSLA